MKKVLIVTTLFVFILIGSFFAFSNTSNNTYHLDCVKSKDFMSFRSCAYLDNKLNPNNEFYDLDLIDRKWQAK